MPDYGKGTMEFQWENDTIILMSRRDELPKEASLKAIERMSKRGAQCFAIFLKENKDQETKDEGLPMEIQELLCKCTSVFEEPQGLPPKRSFDHHIPLNDETKPVNVYPYRRRLKSRFEKCRKTASFGIVRVPFHHWSCW